MVSLLSVQGLHPHRKDGLNQTATVTYDGEDRVTRVDWSPSSWWFTFTYDADGNVTQRQDGNGGSTYNTTTYVYDYLNRRTSETFSSSRTNTYAHDRGLVAVASALNGVLRDACGLDRPPSLVESLLRHTTRSTIDQTAAK